jgi:hypothetical protein
MYLFAFVFGSFGAVLRPADVGSVERNSLGAWYLIVFRRRTLLFNSNTIRLLESRLSQIVQCIVRWIERRVFDWLYLLIAAIANLL